MSWSGMDFDWSTYIIFGRLLLFVFRGYLFVKYQRVKSQSHGLRYIHTIFFFLSAIQKILISFLIQVAHKSLPHDHKDFLNSNPTKFHFHFSQSFQPFDFPFVNITFSIFCFLTQIFLRLSFILSGKKKKKNIKAGKRERENHY